MHNSPRPAEPPLGETPTAEPRLAEPRLAELDAFRALLVELQQKLTFQQRSFEELNTVVLEQQRELEQLRRELHSLRQAMQGLADRGVGDDLPHEKPPHY